MAGNGGALAAFLSSCTWAIGISAYARLSRHHPAYAVNATRALVATPLFIIYLLVESGGPAGALGALAGIGPGRLALLATSVLTSFALGDVLFLRSAAAIGVPAAMSIASTCPLWAAIGGVVFRGDSLSLARLGGVLLVVAGTVVVIASGARRFERSGPPRPLPGRGPGVALAVITSLFWAGNSVAVGLGSQGVPLGAAAFSRMGFALLLCPLLGRVLPALAMPRPGIPPTGFSGATLATGAAPALFVPYSALKSVLWVFVLESFGGGVLFTYGLSHAPIAVGSALSSLAPVLVVPIAVATRAERFSAAKSLGILLVTGGIFLLV